MFIHEKLSFVGNFSCKKKYLSTQSFLFAHHGLADNERTSFNKKLIEVQFKINRTCLRLNLLE